MSIVLWTRLEALEKRVAALEASAVPKKAEPRPPAALTQSNAIRKAEGERLRDEIRRIVGSHAGPEPLSAGAVLRELSSREGGRTVALRTVQWHLRAIRNTPSIATHPSERTSKVGGNR
jgi:hypothetical protein